MRRWKAFRRLSPSQRRLLIKALILLPCVGLGLRLMGLGRVQAALARLSPSPPAPPPNDVLPIEIHDAVRMVEIAAGRGLYRGNCLKQSLVLWWFLRRRGIPSEVRLGVRKEAARFEAHAWVEHLRVPLNDRQGVVSRYTPFDRPIEPAGSPPA